jgi:FkbM family methyltransferase
MIGADPIRAPRHINEMALMARLLDAARRPGVLVDVGTHRGTLIRPFVSAGWRVLGFEPDRDNRRHLESLYAGHGNVTIDARAVAHRTGRARFYTSPASTALGSLAPLIPGHRDAYEVETVTLADALAGHGIAHVDFLKLDAEGFDLPALRGLDWDRLRPDAVQCEFEDTRTRQLGHDMHDIAGFLMERGYTVLVSEWHPLRRYGGPHDWAGLRPYPCTLSAPDSWGNLLGFRTPPDAARLRRAVEEPVQVP